MIILDTNVLSAVMQREPDRAVIAWLDEQPSESVWTTTITIFEIRFALERLVAGRRRKQLGEAFHKAVAEDLGGRVVAFDGEAAEAAARLAAECQKAGRAMDFRDIEIAGIVSSRRAVLATRNTRHFRHFSIELVEPRA